MAILENRFSWSKSRHEKFEECLRQYFLHYYGSWGGWDREAPADVKELYLLKKLTSRHAWAGTAVHDAIKRILTSIRGGVLPEADRVVDSVRASMRAQFRQSRGRIYRSRKAFGLLEHEYEEPVGDEAWKGNWDHVERCIRAFFGSRWIGLAQELPPERWLPVDELGTFAFGDVPVFAAPDFAFRTAEGVEVVDWKTGRQRESDREQLLGYALYAGETWGVAPEGIRCTLVYLPDLEEEAVLVDPPGLKAFRGRMAASIAKMRELLADAPSNVAREEDFPRTANRDACGRCPFRRPCLR